MNNPNADTGKEAIPANLFDCRLIRLFEWDEEQGGTVVVLVPKFRHRFLTWLQDFLRRKYFRIRLDQYGSHIWKLCDGTKLVSQIAESFETQFGALPDVQGRIAFFVKKLERDGLIKVHGSLESNV